MSPPYGFPEGTMFTALCMKCSKTCKQPITVKLVRCPIFEPRIDPDDLMDELEKFEQDALQLKTRTAQLLTEAVQAARNGTGVGIGDEEDDEEA